MSSGPLVNKLKEGLQEAVVFLRTLGSYKIPAVIERRRQELLDKLSLLQEGTMKGAEPKELRPTPPPVAEESLPIERAKDDKKKDDKKESTPPSEVTSPTHKLERKDSKVVSSRIKDYEKIHFTAKKEEESETPKWKVQLKKVAKPTDFPDAAPSPSHSTNSAAEGEAPAASEEPKEESKEEVKVDKKDDNLLDVDQAERERAGSVCSMDEGEGEGEAEGKAQDKKKKKKGSKLPFGSGGLKVKSGKKKDKSPTASPVPERKFEGSVENLVDGGEEAEPEAKPEATEEGVKVFGVLERKLKKGLGGHKKVKLAAKVKHTTLILGGKDDLELANCSVEATEGGFELMHPQHRAGLQFKVEGGEEEKQKWVEALKEAIQEATPPEDKKEEAPAEEVTESAQTPQPPADEIPSITVDEVAPSPSTRSKRESKALTVKPEKRLPDQGVTMKGYLHRKKPGLTKHWEKMYCVLTYQAMYFTTADDKKDYTNVLHISPDSDGKLSETKKGKGHDKHSQVPGLELKLGKKITEQLSFESLTDMKDWKEAIERVLGIGGVEELLSEDEEEIAEDLYEELETDYIPPVPASPRPSRPSVPVSDDILIDEDIYEETDDILPTLQSSLHSPQHTPTPAPSLPDRNPPKRSSSPPPSLPPRGGPAAAEPVPSLPPRNAKPGSAQDHERSTTGKKPAAKPPVPAPEEDEELYDDVVTANAEIEETYDDVLVPEGGGAAIEEDLYDDVVPTTSGREDEPIADENYEDMAPGAPNYVTMEKNGPPEAEDGEELYVDVEEPPVHSQTPLGGKKTPVDTHKAATSKGTFSKMFNKRASSDQKGSLSGTIGFKAPKKSKFDDKWGVIDGSNLLVYKASGDRKHQEKISLGDCRLELGSTEAGAGRFAFRLSKGEKVYHFSLKEATDLEDWVGMVKGLVKYAPVEAKGGDVAAEDEVYQAREDHIAESDSELTFKKGTYIKLIRRETSDLWVGQIGTEEQVFEGKIGKFPANKVELAEDLYI